MFAVTVTVPVPVPISQTQIASRPIYKSTPLLVAVSKELTRYCNKLTEDGNAQISIEKSVV